MLGAGLPALDPGADEERIRQLVRNRKRRIEEIWDFARHFCAVMEATDASHPITVGGHRASNLAVKGEQVDVLSFHDHSPPRAWVKAEIAEALGYAGKLKRLVFVSEIAWREPIPTT